MTKVTNKLFAIVLSFAMIMSGLSLPATMVASAATNATTLTLKVADQKGQAVSGLKLVLNPPADEEMADAIDLVTDENGVASYEVDDDDYPDVVFTLAISGESDYSLETSTTVVLGDGPSGVYVSTVNGAAYDGTTVNVAVKNNNATTEPSTEDADGWTSADFTYTDYSESFRKLQFQIEQLS